MPSPAGKSLDALLYERRTFPPSEEFRRGANWTDPAIYYHAAKDPEGYWAEQAKNLDWFAPWQRLLDWNAPWAKWFVGGKLNVTYNCLDRHLGTPIANKAALIWEGEPAVSGKPGEERTLTYKQLHREVCRFANVLKRNGIKKGDRILIYLPMVPEAAIAMLASARIGGEELGDERVRITASCPHLRPSWWPRPPWLRRPRPSR